MPYFVYEQRLLELITQEQRLDTLFPEGAPRLNLIQLRLSKLALLLGDIFAFVIAFVLSTIFVVNNNGMNFRAWFDGQSSQRFTAWALIVIAGVLILLIRFQHYSERRAFWDELSDFIKLICFLALTDIAMMAFARWNASRLWWLAVWFLSFTSLMTMRLITRQLLKWLRIWVRPTIIIGIGPNAEDAALALHSQPELGLQVIGFVDTFAPSVFGVPATQPRLHQSLIEHVTSQPSVQWVIALEHAESEERERWLRSLAQRGVMDVSVIPAMRGIPLLGTDISHFFSHEVALLRMRNNLRRWPALLTKRVFDTLIALALIVGLSPFLLFIALLIRRDGGPALFAHSRVGKSAKSFHCYKFRTMGVNAEQELEMLLQQQPELREQWEGERKLQYDPRVSRFGKLLRQTSLDELPQLINVIRGDMSLVGPRPVVSEELPRYGDDIGYYLMVRPGMTGLWQISGRSDLDYEKRVYLDTWYVKNWSIWYDQIILFKTLGVVIRRAGAY